MRYITLGGLAMIAVSTSALAQTTIQIGGRVDVGYKQLSNDRTGTTMGSSSPNKINFSGAEELGGGYKAFFVLEERFAIDTGNNLSTAARWQGESRLGIRSDKVGEFNFGRVYSAIDDIIAGFVYDGHYGNTVAGAARYGYKANVRLNNAGKYTTPWIGPFQMTSVISLPETAGLKTPYGLGVTYKQDRIQAALVYQRDVTTDQSSSSATNSFIPANTGNANNPWKTVVVGVNYKFDTFQVYGTAGISKGYNSDYTGGYNLEGAKEEFATLGAAYPVSTGVFKAQYGHYQETSVKGVKQNSLNQIGVSYWHTLSKRTTLITGAVYKKQNGGFNGSSFDSSQNAFKTNGSSNNQTGYEIALRHDF